MGKIIWSNWIPWTPQAHKFILNPFLEFASWQLLVLLSFCCITSMYFDTLKFEISSDLPWPKPFTGSFSLADPFFYEYKYSKLMASLAIYYWQELPWETADKSECYPNSFCRISADIISLCSSPAGLNQQTVFNAFSFLDFLCANLEMSLASVKCLLYQQKV